VLNVADALRNEDAEPLRLTRHSANDAFPDWSSDGTRIVFGSIRSSADVYVMNVADALQNEGLEGSEMQLITRNQVDDWEPDWSPDGTQIALGSQQGEYSNIYVVDVAQALQSGGTDSRDWQQLTDTDAHEAYPDWSPDGTKIAFCSARDGNWEIYVMNSDGSDQRRLTYTDAFNGAPRWSPDGAQIVFESDRDGNSEIYVMNSDGSNVRRLTDNNASDRRPAWRPISTVAPATESPAPTPYPHLEARADVRTYGGAKNDWASDILLTADGGALIVGTANNTQPSHRIIPGNAHLIKTDSEGNVIWEKDYGGENDASFSSIIRAGEDEYVLLGDIAASYSRDESDVYLVKVDGAGNEIWSQTYGGPGMDWAKMVRQVSDGGYILIGSTADEFPTGNAYRSRIRLIKTDADGNQVWSQTYGDSVLGLGWGVAQTPDGGYILTGWEAKTADDRDVVALKTNEVGEVEWSRTWDLVPGDRDGGFDLILTSDGHIVIACIQSMGSGAPSAVLIKLDLEGNEIWNKLIGEEGVGNTFWHIMEDSDGGYVMAGDTHLDQASATGRYIHAGLLIKTDTEGEILWQRIYGEGQYEYVSLIAAALQPGGGYVFVGGAIRDGESYQDMLWLKLTPNDKVSAVLPALSGRDRTVKLLFRGQMCRQEQCVAARDQVVPHKDAGVDPGCVGRGGRRVVNAHDHQRHRQLASLDAG
jgi:hypothetical protein